MGSNETGSVPPVGNLCPDITAIRQTEALERLRRCAPRIAATIRTIISEAAAGR
jgi:hypothetical protein